MTTPPPSTEARAEKVWRVGTLTYTFGGLVVLFGWLLWGDFAWNMKERGVTPVTQLMLGKFHASDMFVGLLVGSLPAALGLLLAPVVGMKSDRHRGRWGRRLPFLLVPTPVVVLAMVGLAYTPSIGKMLHEWLGGHSPGPQLSVLIVLSFFWTLFEVGAVIVNSVFGGLINDVVPQEVLGRFFGLFRAVTLIAGIVFNSCIIGYAREHACAIFLGMALLYGLGFSLMCLNVREGEYPPPETISGVGLASFINTTKTYLTECFSHSYYLFLFGAMALALTATTPVNAFSLFYSQSIGMDITVYGKYLSLTYVISFCIAYSLGSLADRFHPLRVGIAAMALYSVAMLWGGFHATTTETFAIAFVAHGVISGIYFTGAASLGQRLFPKSKFAQYASAAGIVGAVCNMLIAPVIGTLLDYTGHVYRYTFLAGGFIGMLSVFALAVVHRKFMSYGGPGNYTAPE